jgi:hypothetical protein
MHASPRALSLIALLCVTASFVCAEAQARLTRLQIDKREVVAEGRSFADAGPYERLTGTAWFEVDPKDPHNAVVFDLDKAPTNARGMVEFSADMAILKPVDATRSHTLFFEVNNRGRKISFGRMHDTPSDANMNAPTLPRDFGNGFLMRRGYLIAWVGWGADIAPGDNRLTVSFPIAQHHGQPVSERILTEFGDRNFNGATPFTLPLSGGPAFNSFPAVSVNKTAAQAELWIVDSDSPRPSGPAMPFGKRVPEENWAFAACPEGGPGTPSMTDICLKGVFQNQYNYHLIYRATGSPVMGLGYVTSRDFVSFLRNARMDDTGTANPVFGVDTALCQGISSSGMYYRDYLYFGFNEDEQGRRVCDGMHIHVPGAQRLYLNYRFAQPNPFTQQHRERYVPDVNFPVTYAVTRDPLSGREDGILKRPRSDPKIIHTDTSTEYWQFRASLLGADPSGEHDIADPPNVRRYLLAGAQHNWFKGDKPSYGIANRQCEQLSNATHTGVILRALIVDLEEWVRNGAAPPPSRVPRIADGTLVHPEKLNLPAIPGVSFAALYNGSGERDFGPRVKNNAGVIDKPFPDVLSEHRILVPKVDAAGNDATGIRHPVVEVPTATLLGWNTRRAEFGGNDLCDLLGSTIALPPTRALAHAANDPRPALESLYRSHYDYVHKIEQAARALERERLMLPEDVELTVREAQESAVLR